MLVTSGSSAPASTRSNAKYPPFGAVAGTSSHYAKTSADLGVRTSAHAGERAFDLVQGWVMGVVARQSLSAVQSGGR